MTLLPKTQQRRNKRIARSVTARRDTRIAVPTAPRIRDDEDEAVLGDRKRAMITPEWRRALREAMKSRGLNQTKIADLLTDWCRSNGIPVGKPINRAVVNKVLKGALQSSKWVIPVSEVVGISPPSVQIRDALEEAYLDDMRTLRELDRDEADRLIGEVHKSATRALRHPGRTRQDG